MRERADPVLAAVIFALFARTFLFQAFEVPSGSMEKTVLAGDRLLVNRFVYSERGARGSGLLGRLLPARPLRRGDVVVFRFPEDPHRDFIKRVIALPGETVAIRDKRVWVDGRELLEPYAFHADDTTWPDDPEIADVRRMRDQLPERRVPPDTYFVLGDNRDASNDSRFWGPVPDAYIEGRALFVYWSVTPRSSVAPPARGVPLASPVDLLRRTRWDRAFVPVR
ncbi:MAG TPA: signal peptidase I [Thermoanaerobaculia bacterium]|jgi:signal peptidase I